MEVQRKMTDWLPITKAELEAHGWSELDVVIISGDAYVDHPAFGHAVVGRILEAEGLKVGIIPQPNWRDDLRDFKKFGKPKLFFGVTSGCMDSMVNHYTARRRRRSDDAYTPGGESGFRPDYAVMTYTQILKRLYPDVPVVIGGIEASLRRVTHYDYWSDTLKTSILAESGADMLLYGMGELALRELVRLLKRNVPFSSMNTIPQTCVLIDKELGIPKNKKWEDHELFSHDECINDKIKYAKNFRHIEVESNKQRARRLIQGIGDKNLVVNPPYKTMSEKQIDKSFDMAYTRLPHPKYSKRGPIPAFDMIKFSVNMHRGCFGGCSFCTISAHQGKAIASRSPKSILKEVDAVTKMPDFKGYISDLGGPSANMYRMKGIVQSICDVCTLPSCIHPKVCKNLDTNHKDLINLYKEVNKHPEIKKAFVSSGVRYDLLVEDKNHDDKENHMSEYIDQLVSEHVSGRLKVAPEHTDPEVLKVMRKPSFQLFGDFKAKFDKINQKRGLKQQLIPYFISGHPGSTLEAMADIAVQTKDLGFKLEQVQGFTPTPMTVATVIYYSGYHPYSLKKMYTAHTDDEKDQQNQFFFWYKAKNRRWIKDSLDQTSRGKELAARLLDGEVPNFPQPKTNKMRKR